MSIHLVALGTLTADPIRRTGAKGAFATGAIRCHAEDGEYAIVSCVAFGQVAEQLLMHSAAASVAVSGRASLRTWAGKDGKTKCGLSLVVEQIASASGARRADAERRRRSAA